MSGESFEEVRRERLDALGLTYREARHRETGARHVHLETGSSLAAFMVAFQTRPEDSTGVAHVLEHSVLQGSRRFPVRGVFNHVRKRSFASFLNALTGPVLTCYPFCTSNAKDFQHLLAVYLDAVFFPLLDRDSFLQEGHRLEFVDPEEPASGLAVRGVVYNEMKGAFGDPATRLHRAVMRRLYPTLPFGHVSGGDPASIPALTHEALVAFHERNYHPSNALFLSYGDLGIEEIQASLEELVLHRFEARQPPLVLPREQRFDAPRSHEEPYALDGRGEGEKHLAATAWLVGETACVDTRLDVELLLRAVATGAASPLRQALESSGSGGLPVLHAATDRSEASFMAGLVGTSSQGAAGLEALVLEVLDEIAREGLPGDALQASLHQMELELRSTEDHGAMPFALGLLFRALDQAALGGDPLDGLDVAPALERLRRRAEAPDWLPGELRKRLLDNPHRVGLVLRPDRESCAREAASERERLERLRAGLGPEGQQAIVDDARLLRRLQEEPVDAGCLPRLRLSDVPRKLRDCPREDLQAAGLPVSWYSRGTGGLAHQVLSIDLSPMQDRLLDLLPLACEWLREVGCAGLDSRQARARQQAVCGGFRTGLVVRAEARGETRVRLCLRLSGHSLAPRHGEFAGHLRDVYEEPDFGDGKRLAELVRLEQAGLQRIYSGFRPAILAHLSSAAGLSRAAALAQRLEGVDRVRVIRGLHAEGEGLERLQASLREVHEQLREGGGRLLLAGEPGERDRLLADVETTWSGRPATDPAAPVEPAAPGGPTRKAWAGDTRVNYCAVSFPGVPPSHPDRAVLKVLGRLLVDERLHRQVREEGGAYGVQFMDSFGTVGFCSYRDPRIGGTLDDFLRAGEWLATTSPGADAVELAQLAVLRSLDRATSPVAEASRDFDLRGTGYTRDMMRELRERVCSVTPGDLQRAAGEYLRPDAASVGVLASREALDAEAELDLEVSEI